jgi:hypothetical protein
MKKLIIFCLLLCSLHLKGQNKNGVKAELIANEYCELVMVKKPLSSNYRFVVYFGNDMQQLLDDNSKPLEAEKTALPGLDWMAPKGWEVVTTYQDNRGGMILVYLLKRKKKE